METEKYHWVTTVLCCCPANMAPLSQVLSLVRGTQQNIGLSSAHRGVGSLEDHSPVSQQTCGLCSFALLSLSALISALLGC